MVDDEDFLQVHLIEPILLMAMVQVMRDLDIKQLVDLGNLVRFSLLDFTLVQVEAVLLLYYVEVFWQNTEPLLLLPFHQVLLFIHFGQLVVHVVV